MLALNPLRSYVAQLEEVLKELPRAALPETVRQNRLLIAQIGRPQHVLPMLEEILEDKHRLADIAGRSYHHVNHFDKVVLVGNADPDAYRLTLHLWYPPYTETELRDEMI